MSEEIGIGSLVYVNGDKAKRIGEVINIHDIGGALSNVALVAFTWNMLAVADREHLEMVHLQDLRLANDR